MDYQEFKPHHQLAPYIDAYWIMRSSKPAHAMQRIMPDGCIDIIINSGNDITGGGKHISMKHESSYLVGTMTRFSDILYQADTQLLGIRFKPLGFPAFYKFSSLHEITNKTIEFPEHKLPEIFNPGNQTKVILDSFFLNKKPSPLSLAEIIESIQQNNGNITVEKLARKHFITNRQLERKFKQYIGLTPKEYLDFARYQFALRKLALNIQGKSLLDIALDAGYYDHSHLTNEIKKYSGRLPSEF